MSDPRKPVIAISSSACFYPEEDDAESFGGQTITWTFEVLKDEYPGPGLYRIEFIRNLSKGERHGKVKPEMLLAEREKSA